MPVPSQLTPFTSETASMYARTARAELKQCVTMQTTVFEAFTHLKKIQDLDEPRDQYGIAQSIRALIHAWNELADRRRILNGKPLPGEALRILRDPIALKKIATRAGFEQRPAAMIAGEFTDLDAVASGPDTTTGSGAVKPPESPTPQSTETPLP